MTWIKKSNAPPTLNADNFEESKEDDSSVTVTIPPPKTSPTPHMHVQKPIAFFPNQLKGKMD